VSQEAYWPDGIARGELAYWDGNASRRLRGASSNYLLMYVGGLPVWVPPATLNALMDHGQLIGLADDDHTQYARLAGRAGGQFLYGGTNSNETLELHGNSHALDNGIVAVVTTRGDGGGAQLNLVSRSATPAANDYAGYLSFLARDSALTAVQAGQIAVYTPVITPGAVSAAMSFYALDAGVGRYLTWNPVARTFFPNDNGIIDLGLNANRFRHLYLGGTVFCVDVTATGNANITGALTVGGAVNATGNITGPNLVATPGDVYSRAGYYTAHVAAAGGYQVSGAAALGSLLQGDGSVYAPLAPGWTNYTYNAADFTANAGVWAVDAADVQSCAYRVVGKTMTVQFAFPGTSTSALCDYLQFKIPGGYTSARYMHTAVNAYAGGEQHAMAWVNAGSTNISFCQGVIGLLGAQKWPVLANALHIYGSFSFEVQ